EKPVDATILQVAPTVGVGQHCPVSEDSHTPCVVTKIFFMLKHDRSIGRIPRFAIVFGTYTYQRAGIGMCKSTLHEEHSANLAVAEIRQRHFSTKIVGISIDEDVFKVFYLIHDLKYSPMVAARK